MKKLKLSLSAGAKRDQSKREAVNDLIRYMESRTTMMNYRKLIDEDLVIASDVIEGAARYVIGERMDCSGMRWIPERAESLLHLRCIELNGDWDDFSMTQMTGTDLAKKILSIRADITIIFFRGRSLRKE